MGMFMAAKKAGRKSIDPKVKEQALELLRGGKSAKEVSDTLALGYSTVMNWTKKKVAKKKSSKKKSASPSDDIELLKLENEYLKKKLAYYEG
jgi:transposase-like protein